MARQHGRLKISSLWINVDEHRQRPSSSSHQRYQYLQDLTALVEILSLEGLVYPALADVCGWVAECCNEELILPQGRAAVRHEECRVKGQDAARIKLRMAVMCTGQNSQIVADILTWMEGLRF